MQFDMNIMNNSYLETDMNIYRQNMNIILSSLPESCTLIPVLKCNAYGLGMAELAKPAEELARVSYIAVSHVSEGLELRAAGITKDILVMSSALPSQFAAAVLAHLTLAARSAGFVCALDAAAGSLGMAARIHIKIDTGLHRIGSEPGAELDELIDALRGCKHIEPTGVFSHFADTDNEAATRGQYELFTKALAQLESAGYTSLMRHISCSAAFEKYPEYSLDAVRIGRGLLMNAPYVRNGKIGEIASWRTFITALKPRRAGDSLGYGGAFHLEHDAIIATLGIGYGDGLDRGLCTVHAPVLIRGQKCPLLTCCMDQSFVDVTGLDCEVGDEVTIFGRDSAGNFLSSQAQAELFGGDEGCGMTSALSTRVARVYINK